MPFALRFLSRLGNRGKVRLAGCFVSKQQLHFGSVADHT